MKPLPLARALALAAPVALLGGAYASQYIGGLAPCEMCWWQRYPHMVAIAFALLAYGMARQVALSRALTLLAAVAILVSGVIGLFHAGVEYGWWEGLTACSTTSGVGSAADMLDAIMAAPITRCDVAPWSMLGISLAGYNGLLSVAAALAIFMLCAKARRGQGRRHDHAG